MEKMEKMEKSINLGKRLCTQHFYCFKYDYVR